MVHLGMEDKDGSSADEEQLQCSKCDSSAHGDAELVASDS